jgi:tRNA pseudouridine38-40 synthase
VNARIKLIVAYYGDPFSGWQRQPGRRTVQGELERAIATMTGGLSTAVVGAGRTDAGVHAAGQAAHLDLAVDIPPDALLRALNQHLPREIRVRSARPVVDSFHARRSALAKIYSYRARWRSPGLPWLGLNQAVVEEIIDPEAVERSLARLAGHNDMASFTVPELGTESTHRTLFRAWLDHRRGGVDFHFLGDGFLRYQVRRMVGALLDVGRGRMTESDFLELLSRPRPGAPIHTAPARGLTLQRVLYRRSAALRLP